MEDMMQPESLMTEDYAMAYRINDSIVFSPCINELSTEHNKVKLAHTEAKTFHILLQNVGNVVEKDTITNYSWGGRIVTDASLAKSISNIRKALRECGHNEDVIITIPRVGYRLVCNVEPQDNQRKVNGVLSCSANDETIDAKLNHKDVGGSITKNKRRIVIKPIAKMLMAFSSILLVSISFYNFFIKVSNDLDRVFIAKEYEDRIIDIGGQKIKTITKKNALITSEMKDIIALSPSGAIVFIQNESGVYNVSYYISERRGISFTFSVKNYSKGVCNIKKVFSEGDKVCVM